jgi:hypothetical protein
MMLLITIPDHSHAEFRWIVSVLLGEFLGLAYDIAPDPAASGVRISAGGKSLHLPDVFFDGARHDWLGPSSLPAGPLIQWEVSGRGLTAEAIALASARLPVLFGAPGLITHASGDATLRLDVFGSAFYMLSRYEEAVCAARDRHDRFPAAASLAGRAGFLERPIIDEYVEILWAALTMLWPRLTRRPHRFCMRVSCDVDHPYHPGAASIPRMLRRSAGQLLRRGSLCAAAAPVRNYFASRKGDWRNDPYYHTVDWMMDVNERAGNRIAFYFIPEITDRIMDDTCPIGEAAVAAMMTRIARRGHEIGIHPGYYTYRSQSGILSGLARLRQALDDARIAQPIDGGRQHYLRWSTHTPALWDKAGLRYDSTLGYADHAGFRCGTCHEYPMYDLHRRRPLEIRQRPLLCMDGTVVDYMGHGFSDAALGCMLRLRDMARRFHGNFTLLWHNSFFEAPGARDMYREVIAP